MANRRFDRPWCIGERDIIIKGSFVPLTGAGTVVASSVKGFGFGYAPIAGVMTLQPSARPGITGTPGVVRTSTGLYTVTLDDSYLDLEYLEWSLQVPAAGYGAAVPDVYPVTLPTFGVSGAASSFAGVILTTSTGAPVDSIANCRLNFFAICRDSTERFGKP